MAKKPKKADREVAVIDFETDPFKFDRVPAPFACGVLWRGIYVDFWGPDCWRAAADYLLSIEVPLVCYAHNGGKFDFFFLWSVLENPVKIINGRIVAARIGIHEFRDSWSIMPFALAKYKKTEIDYAKFEPDVRDQHRAEILNYLHDDCRDLMDLCAAFVKRFGFKLTIAGTAMAALQEIHPQDFCNETHDDRFRSWYFGGRVECFDSGVKRGAFRVYDVNSMYPSVMRNADHPSGGQYVTLYNPRLDATGWIDGYPGCMYFAEVEGDNLGALPSRSDDRNGGLRFDLKTGIFQTNSHELRVALALGKFRPHKVHVAYIPCYTQRFEKFVDTYFDMKAACKVAGDRIGELQYKFLVNSAYGKFGQDPSEFLDYFLEIRGSGVQPPWAGDEESNPWSVQQSADRWIVWGKPAPQKRFFDVAIAASVTGASRAVLMLGIAGAKRPIYCDTDSIICESLRGVKLDEHALGAWKLEASGDRLAIAGKKLYALFDGDKVVKKASKGVKLAALDIEKIALGGEVMWRSDAPNFALNGSTRFISRIARKTV